VAQPHQQIDAAAQGRPDDALRFAARAVSSAERTDSPVAHAVARLDQAHTLRLLGLDDRARSAASAARELFAAKGHLPGERWAASLLHERE
uniref:hypothetical protein n=1 Tax=Streptomyces shenzhenensis TaxID=943815 RepID=UPI0015F0454E